MQKSYPQGGRAKLTTLQAPLTYTSRHVVDRHQDGD